MLYAERILDELEKIAHQKYLTDETHQKAAESKDKQTLCAGTDETEDKEYGEADDTHQFLTTVADQVVEEG